MRLLIVMNLNDSLMRAKLVPILRTGLVERITVVARRVGPPLDRVDYVVVPDRGGVAARTASLFAAVLRTAQRARPDVVLAYNLVPFGMMALVAARALRVPFVLNIIGGAAEIAGGGYELDSNRILARLRGPSPSLERVLVWLARRADVVTTTGSRTRHFLIGEGLDPAAIHEIASAIDPLELRPEPQPLRWDVLCISALYANKRVMELVEIAAELRAHRPGLQVAIAGTGPLERELVDRIRALGLEDTVHLLGFRRDVRELLRASRIFAMPSRAEGLPLSMIEAAACGVPVVMCDVGDIRDLIEDRVTGRLVAIDDLAGFGAAVRELLEQPAQREAYAAAALEAVRARYAIDRAADAWRALLHHFT